jgi:hypothetical protein
LTTLLGSSLGWEVRNGAERGSPAGPPIGYEECPSRCGKLLTNHPTQEGEIAEAERQKVTREERAPLKDVKNEDRSGNVYENKGSNDNLPDANDDISA